MTTRPPTRSWHGLPGVAEHHHHHHPHAHGSGPALRAAAALTIGFAAVEAAGGWWTGSLALLSDAGHMLTDGAALGLGALAAWVARRPPSARHSYGLGRAEVFAALANALAMLLIVALLGREAFLRFQAPAEVKGGAAALIALAGLALNLIILRRLAPHGHDMNARAARLHVVGDALGSLAALVSGLVIALAGWTPIDPLASLVICGLIALSGLRLTLESLHALMEGVPGGLSVEEIGREMASVEGVLSVHDLHVWMLSGSRTALSAHVVVASLAHWDLTLAALQQRLQHKFRIDHVTLQPESGARPLVRH
jgi:cobalt-zinc-cadmium efflux system protein